MKVVTRRSKGIASNYIYFRDPILLLNHVSLKQLTIDMDIYAKYGFKKLYINHNKITKDNYELKYPLISKYLQNDVLSLRYVLIEFQYLSLKIMKINGLGCYTLPELVFKYYKHAYAKKASKIRKITDKVENFIRKSYRGGRCEVFRPFGKKIFSYDVNGLYAYIMKKFDLPQGRPKVYNVKKGLENLYGFAYVRVKTPNGLYVPVLGTKVKDKGVEKYVFPVGE